jgi:hypothetical protein
MLNVESLVNEQGEKPDTKLQFNSKTLWQQFLHLMADSLMQQTNFRLIQPGRSE